MTDSRPPSQVETILALPRSISALRERFVVLLVLLVICAVDGLVLHAAITARDLASTPLFWISAVLLNGWLLFLVCSLKSAKRYFQTIERDGNGVRLLDEAGHVLATLPLPLNARQKVQHGREGLVCLEVWNEQQIYRTGFYAQNTYGAVLQRFVATYGIAGDAVPVIRPLGHPDPSTGERVFLDRGRSDVKVNLVVGRTLGVFLAVSIPWVVPRIAAFVQMEGAQAMRGDREFVLIMLMAVQLAVAALCFFGAAPPTHVIRVVLHDGFVILHWHNKPPARLPLPVEAHYSETQVSRGRYSYLSRVLRLRGWGCDTEYVVSADTDDQAHRLEQLAALLNAPMPGQTQHN